MKKRSALVNRRQNTKTVVEDAVSYVENYTEETVEGVFKVSKSVIGISSTSVPIVRTDTIFMSQDVGTAKQIFEFRQRDEPINFSNVTEVVIAYEFPDIEVGERIISYKVEDKNRDYSRIEFILESQVLDVGNTRVNQYVYLLFADGTSIDAGIVAFNLGRSFIDSNIDNIEDFYIRKLDDVREYLLYRANEIIARLLNLEGEFHDLDFEQLATRRQLEEAVGSINTRINDVENNLSNTMSEQRKEFLENLLTQRQEIMSEVNDGLNQKVDKTYINANMPTKIAINEDKLLLKSKQQVLSHVDLVTEVLLKDMLDNIFNME